MKQQQIKFTIRTDVTVQEEVLGVICNQCTEITKNVERELGTVTQTKYKPDYYKPCDLPQVKQQTEHLSPQS